MEPEKAIIFDAGTLISFFMNGLTEELKKLKKSFDGKFIITKEVKYEIIDHPIKIRRFELEAMIAQELLDNKIIELPSSMGIDEKEITKNAQEIMKISNSIFKDQKRDIHLIDLGEASCLALGEMLDKKGTKNLIGIDERTMRILCEKPENLKEILQKKLHVQIKYDKDKINYFKKFKIIRSCELIYVAYKKGLTSLSGKKALEAYMYALKFKGCSISEEEIKKMLHTIQKH